MAGTFDCAMNRRTFISRLAVISTGLIFCPKLIEVPRRKLLMPNRFYPVEFKAYELRNQPWVDIRDIISLQNMFRERIVAEAPSFKSIFEP